MWWAPQVSAWTKLTCLTQPWPRTFWDRTEAMWLESGWLGGKYREFLGCVWFYQMGLLRSGLALWRSAAVYYAAVYCSFWGCNQPGASLPCLTHGLQGFWDRSHNYIGQFLVIDQNKSIYLPVYLSIYLCIYLPTNLHTPHTRHLFSIYV